MTNRLQTFRPELLKAFEKMILGVNVELSEKGKEEINKTTLKGRWFFIVEMTCDESITIEDQWHSQYSGITIDNIKL